MSMTTEHVLASSLRPFDVVRYYQDGGGQFRRVTVVDVMPVGNEGMRLRLRPIGDGGTRTIAWTETVPKIQTFELEVM